jgi:3-hydroxyacyl-[acyl-carrier-protein] dehydratase
MTELKRAILAAAAGDPSFPEPGTAVRAYRFEAGFLGFSGHFPGFPVLPALVQVLTAVTVAEALLGRPLELATLENAKFHIQIEPGTEVSVYCQERESAERRWVDARVLVPRGLASSFRLTFAAGGAQA